MAFSTLTKESSALLAGRLTTIARTLDRAPRGADADLFRAERDFIHAWLATTNRGVSSDALVCHAVGVLDRPRSPGWTETEGAWWWRGDECDWNCPHDAGDLARCEHAYEIAPPHLQERMLPVLEEFRRYVNDRLNRYGQPVGTAHPTEAS